MAIDRQKRRKILIIGLSIGIFLTILRETGTVNLNWFDSNIQSTTYTNWSDQGFTYDAEKSTVNPQSLSDSCDYGSPRNVPVAVWCGDYIYGDTGYCERVYVFIDDIHYGFVYSPLYKSTHFNVTVNCGSPLRFFAEHDSTVTVHGINLSGNISVDGYITIWGFMSARSSKQQIKEYICKEVYNQVVAHLQASQ